MKGINRRVIEIVDTENEAIERVLVFFKPGAANMKLSTQKAQAEKYVAGLVCWRRLPWLTKTRALMGICVAAAALLAGGIWIF
ncbi:MAG: hypothetical protein KBG54_01120 [Oscillospiraceae bacterium]|nr:hypothetical protein [Oscillospiraceae bacterium]